MKQARRYLESIAFIAIWMIAGWVFHLDAYVYLLLGVPLVALFQLVIRRQRLQTLWVRDAVSFRLDLPGVAVAVALMAVPAYLLVVEAVPTRQWSIILWFVCCLVGAVCAAFALRRQDWRAARHALLPFGTAIVCGCLLMVVAALANHKSPIVAAARLVGIPREFLLFFPVCFVLEEVVFRGAIDSHLSQPADKPETRAAWISAFFVSALWGIWHLPLLQIPDFITLVVLASGVAGVHTAVGVPLSICWRRSGTLLLPAAAHALIDAYRDAVMQ
jgi:membrane protease YdiL (CAAX protease family)